MLESQSWLASILPRIEILDVSRYRSGHIPDGHVGAGDDRELDGARETLVTLGVIVLEADLELDGLEEVTLLGVERVVEQLADVGTHSGD